MSHSAAPPAPAAPSSSSALQASDPQAGTLREQRLHQWLSTVQAAHGLRLHTLRPAWDNVELGGRYLRVDTGSGSCLVLDAPPDGMARADLAQVAALLAGAGCQPPPVLASDPAGFALLGDPGARPLHDSLATASPSTSLGLYLEAIDTLVRWQQAPRQHMLPVRTSAQQRAGLDSFQRDYLQGYRGLSIDPAQAARLNKVFGQLVQEDAAWSVVPVHGHFTSHALFGAQSRGVIDFQDAHRGAPAHDIASLVRTVSPAWEEEFVLDISVRYWQKARAAGLPVGDDFGALYRAIEWAGLQRHLRILGRLAQRHGGAMGPIPATTAYVPLVRATAARYIELKPLLRLLDAAEGIQDATGFAFGRV